MTTTTPTQDRSRLSREITHLAQEALAYPLLAVQRGQQIGALYTEIASLKGASQAPLARRKA